MPQKTLEEMARMHPRVIFSLPFSRDAMELRGSVAGDLVANKAKLAAAKRLLETIALRLVQSKVLDDEQHNWCVTEQEPRTDCTVIEASFLVAAAAGHSLSDEKFEDIQTKTLSLLTWGLAVNDSGEQKGTDPINAHNQADNERPFDHDIIYGLRAIADERHKVTIKFDGDAKAYQALMPTDNEPAFTATIDLDAVVNGMKFDIRQIQLRVIDKAASPLGVDYVEFSVEPEMYVRLLREFEQQTKCRFTLNVYHDPRPGKRKYMLKNFTPLDKQDTDLFT